MAARPRTAASPKRRAYLRRRPGPGERHGLRGGRRAEADNLAQWGMELRERGQRRVPVGCREDGRERAMGAGRKGESDGCREEGSERVMGARRKGKRASDGCKEERGGKE
jgi:hypothetical protein